MFLKRSRSMKKSATGQPCRSARPVAARLASARASHLRRKAIVLRRSVLRCCCASAWHALAAGRADISIDVTALARSESPGITTAVPSTCAATSCGPDRGSEGGWAWRRRRYRRPAACPAVTTRTAAIVARAGPSATNPSACARSISGMPARYVAEAMTKRRIRSACFASVVEPSRRGDDGRSRFLAERASACRAMNFAPLYRSKQYAK